MTVAGRETPIKIGMIGLGKWARKSFVPILKERSDVRVEAVAAPSQRTRDLARSMLGETVDLYTDYSGLLRDAAVDAVMIGMQPALTPAAALAAVEAGKHVFFEPPMTGGAEVDRVLGAAGQSRQVFHADLEIRYLPVMTALTEIVSEERLGPLSRVRVELDTILEAPYAGPITSGFGSWYVDLVDAFTEQPSEQVQLERGEHESMIPVLVGKATMLYPGGCVGEWVFDFRNAKKLGVRLRLVGDEGEADADMVTGEYRYRSNGSGWKAGKAGCSQPVHGFVGMRESIEGFLAAIRGERPTLSGPDVCRRIHTTVEALARLEIAGVPR